jgi:hypothetical protein
MIIRTLPCPDCDRRIDLDSSHLRVPFARPGAQGLAGERSEYRCDNCKASFVLRPRALGVFVLLFWSVGVAAAWFGGFNRSAILAIAGLSLVVLFPIATRLVPVRDSVA